MAEVGSREQKREKGRKKNLFLQLLRGLIIKIPARSLCKSEKA